MDNPTPPDAGRTYSDAEIDLLLYQIAWQTDHLATAAPGYMTTGQVLAAIIRQLRAERDTARREVRDLRENIELYERKFYSKD